MAYSLATTAANVSDVPTAHVLHGSQETVHGDDGYQGVGKRDENKGRGVAWETAMKRGKRRRLDRSGPEEAGPLPRPGEEPAADRVAARLREPADRGPVRDGVTAASLRPFPAETAANGTKGMENDVSGAVFETSGTTFVRGNGHSVPKHAARACWRRETGC